MKGFLKEHFVLMIGVSLPLILSLIFFLSANLPFETISPPQYAFVFAQDFYYRNNPNYPYQLVVNEQKALELHYSPPEKDNMSWTAPMLFLCDPKSKKVEKIDLPQFDAKEAVVVPFPALKDKQFDPSLTSPDGFTFRTEYQGSGNLMTELFGGGYSGRSRIILSKDGHDFPIKTDAPYYYGQGDLIGWVVKE
ncbi:MAG: hypothetical protein H6858_00780 [Rhodospirillales bacterium]|nr:hypothetical protein [Alphaproteobacteria bacterium]MCB9976115.1 hypothetical protein [Rhodospirillales bacterium]